MEGLIILIVLAVLAAIFGLPIAAIVKASAARREVDELNSRLQRIEGELRALRRGEGGTATPAAARREIEELRTELRSRETELHGLRHEQRGPAEPKPVAPVVSAAPVASPAPIIPKPVESVEKPWPPAPGEEKLPPPPMPPPVVPAPSLPSLKLKPEPQPKIQPEPVAAPKREVPPQPAPVPPPEMPSLPKINWEQFMGAKLFAWLGGLALFLGVAFFVKYSFENNLIPPAVRMAIGFLTGLALLTGGVLMKRKAYAVTSQTLCATGVVVLYTVTFACRALYHFEFFGVVPTFLLMSLITATAFLLAVRLDAQVVAVLGILGGFLTPVLLSTGQDNPGALFGYIALLDIGLLAVALHRRWFHLVPLGVAGTVLMQAGWAMKFFAPEKVITAMVVCLGFSALFVGAAWTARRMKRQSPLLAQSAVVLPCVAFCAAWFFLGYPEIAARTWLFFGYVFLAGAGLFLLAWSEKTGELVAGAAFFTAILIARWAGVAFTGTQMPLAMTVCLVFCCVYLAVFLIAQRAGLKSESVFWSAVALPAVALGFAWHFLHFPEAAARTGMIFGFVFVVSLFVYIPAWCRGVGRLVPCVAGATALLMVRWSALTFNPAQAPVLVTVCLVFCGIYLAVYLLARWKKCATPPVMWAAVGMPGVALGFAFFLLNHAAVGARPGLIFSFILLADAVLLAIAWLDERLPRLHLVAGLAVFALLSSWTARHLTDALLPWALAVYLLFAALHTVFPLMLERRRPAASPTWWSQLFPPLALLLMLFPIVKLAAVSLLVWPAILLVDLLAIGLAVITASLASVAAVLLMTLFATGICLFKIPVAAVFPPALLFVIAGFAVFFFAASLWLVRRLGDKLPAADSQLNRIFGDARTQLPAFSSLLPFLLLIMACGRLTIPNPSPVFGLGLLLVVLTLGLARLLVIEWLPACAIAGIGALEYAWHARQFSAQAPMAPLLWYVGFHAIFAAYPFVFRRIFTRMTGPWVVAALSGVVQFPLVYRVINHSMPNGFMGLLPALFALPPLASLAVILKTVPEENPRRLGQIALFGGVALLFITLIFPIQFERQWLTVAWALEGAALCWLFHRVPHPGLRLVGVALLVTAFARLALNPAVLAYHPRSATGILNWYLYAYGIVTACLFAGAQLLAPPRERVLGNNVRPLLFTLGTVLAFLLVNIEIADWFTPAGAQTLTFQFSGNLARDMSYSIAWALFALLLLIVGIAKRTAPVRYASIGLLGVTLLKLFFHDLAHLGQLYRIGALVAVAIIAMVASFLYQRFLASPVSSDENNPPPTAS